MSFPRYMVLVNLRNIFQPIEANIIVIQVLLKPTNQITHIFLAIKEMWYNYMEEGIGEDVGVTKSLMGGTFNLKKFHQWLKTLPPNIWLIMA